MNYKKPDGTNIDSWSFEALVDVVSEFLEYQNSLYSQNEYTDNQPVAETTQEEQKETTEDTPQTQDDTNPSVEVADKDASIEAEEEEEEVISDIELPPVSFNDFVETQDIRKSEHPVFDRIKVPSYSV